MLERAVVDARAGETQHLEARQWLEMLQPVTGELAVIELEDLEILHSFEVRECGVCDWRASETQLAEVREPCEVSEPGVGDRRCVGEIEKLELCEPSDVGELCVRRLRASFGPRDRVEVVGAQPGIQPLRSGRLAAVHRPSVLVLPVEEHRPACLFDRGHGIALQVRAMNDPAQHGGDQEYQAINPRTLNSARTAARSRGACAPMPTASSASDRCPGRYGRLFEKALR